MGHLSEQGGNNLTLSTVDRTNAANAGAGMTPQSEHVILLGQNAGDNLGAVDVIALGEKSAGGNSVGLGSNADPAPVMTLLALGNRTGENLNGTDPTRLILIGHDIEPENTSRNSILIGHGLDTSAQALQGSVVVSAYPLTNITTPRVGCIAIFAGDTAVPQNFPTHSGLFVDGSIVLQSTSGGPSGNILIDAGGAHVTLIPGTISLGAPDSSNFMSLTTLADIRLQSPGAVVHIAQGSGITGVTITENLNVAAAADISGPLTIVAGSKLETVVQGNIAYSMVTDVATGGFTRFGWTGTEFGIGQISGETLVNHAAAAIATLTNAPVAGNPTKWVSFNDNGTVRRIPMW